MWPFKKKTTQSKPKGQSFTEILEHTYDYDKYFTEDLITWFANETDPLKLASAYCIINTWGWPEFMPMPDSSFDFNTHGHGLKSNYSMIKFSSVIMNDLETKCERLSPGTLQQVWLSKIYRKYDRMKKEIENK